jgi:type I restriction enzyme S subunit
MTFPAYPEYKDSGIEWLGKVPKHWDVMGIKWLSAVQRGASPRPIDDPKYFDDDGEYAWVRISDVSSSNGVLRETTQRLSDLGSSLSVKLTPNTLFISIAGTVGKPCITEIYACIHDGFVYFPNLKLNPKWLFRIFESGLCYAGLGKMGTQLNLNTDTIGSIRVPVPTSIEIEDILVFLDHETAKIDALIKEQQQLIELLNEKRQSIISNAVCRGLDPNVPMKDSGVEWLGMVPEHWEVKRAKYLGNAFNGLTYSPDDVVDEGKGVLVLRSSNIQNGELSFTDNVHVNLQVPNKSTVKKNDILICSRNGSRALIGKNVLIPEELEGVAFGAFMMIFRGPFNNYLYWVFNSQLFKFQSSMFLTSTINQLLVQDLYGFEIPLPSIEEQNEIVVYLKQETTQIDVLITESRQLVLLFEERRSALITAAVAGQIDVRNYQPRS